MSWKRAKNLAARGGTLVKRPEPSRWLRQCYRAFLRRFPPLNALALSDDCCTTNAQGTAGHPRRRRDRLTAASNRFNDRLRRHVFFILAVLDQIVDDSGIRQRRGITEAARLVLGDLAQDPPHDL